MKTHGTNPRAQAHTRQRQAAYGREQRRLERVERKADPSPWTDLNETWWAALESQGSTYGLARRVPADGGVSYDVLDRTTGEWTPSPLAGAGYFTEIGGVTDAVPITSARADELLAQLVPEGGTT